MGPEGCEAGAFFERKNTKCLHGHVVKAQMIQLHWFLGLEGMGGRPGGPGQGEVCEGGRPGSGTWGSAMLESPGGDDEPSG